jgi:predicted 2-oxoglutarate/Fe(II)-dependent dioxygenase YbiX/peroxiredoxin
MSEVIGLERGERAPDMVLPAADGTPTRYYAHAGGRPALLVFADAASAPRLAALAAALDDDAIQALTIHVVGPASLGEAPLPFSLLTDTEGKAAKAYRTQGVPTAFLLDANLRVRTSLAFDEPTQVAAAAEKLLAQIAAEQRPAREIGLQAPLLVVPDVLTSEQCADLIDVWERDGNEATGAEASADGRRAEQISASLKRRRDHVVTDAERTRFLATTVGRRVMPEVSKAFAYRATRFEGFKIACYEASDLGFFRAHRDNLSPSTAHRRFALTLNLNDGYEGGQLRFPEYGPELYRPPPGAALIFSCSHLHEVLDVTAARRFVLLSFLFGDS